MAPPPAFHIETIDPDASPTLALAIATMSGLASIGLDMPTPTETLGAAIATISGAFKPGPTGHSPDKGDDSGGGTGDCSLLGSFALIVQLALGVLALSSLVFKRWRERPQRPLKIWFFDASKQVFGSVLVHMANVFMSMLTSGRFSIKLEPAAVQNVRRLMARGEDDYTPNPCSFYLLNLAIDTTVGIPILIILLKIFTSAVSYTPLGNPPESIQSGNYGSPPRAWWWLKQSVIYFCGLFGMKICVLIIFLLMPWISRVGDWALRWTEGNEQLQIVFVMMLFPLIMNALQYYIIDSFIKQKQPDHEPIPEEDPDWATGNAGNIYDDGLASDIEDDLSSNDGDSLRLQKAKLANDGEYNPDIDGDVHTVVGSSSSHREDTGKILPKELFPKE